MLVQPRKIELHDEPELHAPPGGLVVRVRAALTDGTDLKAFRRGHPQMPMPTRFGHEFSGDVVELGEGVTGWAVGDAVMCVHSAPCGSCFWCEKDEEELCSSVMSTKILGAYAECIAVPEHIVAQNCYPKPRDLPYDEAAFLEPLACVVHSVSYAGVRAGDWALVLGDGGFGLLHAEVLRAQGVRVILAGRRDERLEIARSFGIECVVDTKMQQIDAIVSEQTDDRGIDCVIECTGSEEVWERAPHYARRGGTVLFFGGLPASASVTFLARRMHYDEVKLLSPFHFSPRDVRAAYELLVSGKIVVSSLVTSTFPLHRIGEVFAELDAGRGVKYAIIP
ncbi:MAG: zinc-dependent alcohol dehydrogenase [Vulcanimicrobiaceae bacterium]